MGRVGDGQAATAHPTWDGFAAAEIARRCDVPGVELLAETDSTLDVAHALAERGARSGTLVVADCQRVGRGRHGRSWSSEPGRGVWCTVIERPSGAEALEVLSIRVGTEAAESLDALAGETVGVKWPNDLMLRAGKLAGILTEARWSGPSLGWVAVGVGVNVLPPIDVPHAAGLPAGVRRIDVLAATVRAIRQAARMTGHLTAAELKRYDTRDVLSGRRLVSPCAGVARGIAASGALIVQTSAGEQLHRAGTVQCAEEEVST